MNAGSCNPPATSDWPGTKSPECRALVACAGLGYWSLFPREDPHRFLGWILLLPYPDFGDEIEIGWRLDKQCRGRGYATEAASAILNHALSLSGVATVVADIHPKNIASIKVAEKTGLKFSEDRTLDNQILHSYQRIRQ